MSDVQFIDGLHFKAPHEKAPDFVKAKGSIKIRELEEWLAQQDGEWVNFDVKVSRAGKWYCAVDTWEPTKDQQYKEGMDQARQAAIPQGLPQEQERAFEDDPIPFSNYEYRTLV